MNLLAEVLREAARDVLAAPVGDLRDAARRAVVDTIAGAEGLDTDQVERLLDAAICREQRVPLPAGWRSMAEALLDPDSTADAQVVARGLAWAGRVTLLAAREGLGKSTLVGAAAACVTAGRDFLGAPTIQGHVVVLDLEEADADLLRRLVVHRADAERVTYTCSTADPLADLEAVCRTVQPVLVVVDSLATLAGAEGITEAGSSAQWTPLLVRLAAIARETGAAVVIVHHARKDGADYRDSTAIGASVDVVALLRPPGEGDASTVRHLNYRKSRVPIEDLCVEFVGDGFNLATETTMQDRVVAFVAANDGSSLRALRGGVAGRNQDIDGALAALLAMGRITDSGSNGARCLHVPPGHTPGTVREKPMGHAQGTVRARSEHGAGHAPVPTPSLRGRGTVRGEPARTPVEDEDEEAWRARL
jgi:hypothetical protein